MNLECTTRRLAACALLAATLAPALVPGAAAQAYPDNKVVRVVVPYPTGNSADLLARAISKKLAESTGGQFVVENRPGNTGHVGGDLVAKSKPDGHTLLASASSTITVSPNVLRNLAYDTTNDLLPIGIIAMIPSVLVVPASAPYSTLQELVAYGRANPGTLTFASYGIGSNLHLAGELLKKKAGITAQHVPYNASQLLPDLVAGRVHFMFDSVSTVLPHIRAGTLKAIALASEDVVASLPGVPPVAATYPGFSINAWIGLFAPKGTPPAVLGRLESEFRKGVRSDELRRLFRESDMIATDMDSARTTAYVRSERARWGAIVNEVGFRMD